MRRDGKVEPARIKQRATLLIALGPGLLLLAYLRSQHETFTSQSVFGAYQIGIQCIGLAFNPQETVLRLRILNRSMNSGRSSFSNYWREDLWGHASFEHYDVKGPLERGNVFLYVGDDRSRHKKLMRYDAQMSEGVFSLRFDPTEDAGKITTLRLQFGGMSEMFIYSKCFGPAYIPIYRSTPSGVLYRLAVVCMIIECAFYLSLDGEARSQLLRLLRCLGRFVRGY